MKVQHHFTVLAALCGAGLLVSGCDADRNRDAGAPAVRVERSTGQKVDDKQLTGQVKDALEENAAYKFPDVRVETYGGKVQLSGFVATREQKEAAEAIARRLAGADHVENKISVK